MRAAPPAAVPAGADPGWRAFQAACAAVAAASIAAWAGAHAGVREPVVWVAAAALVALIAWRVSRVAPVELVWDGARWSCDAEPVDRVQAMIDLDRWMLVRVQRDVPPLTRWLAVRSATAGAAWSGWRAAVYCPATPAGPGPAPRPPD